MLMFLIMRNGGGFHRSFWAAAVGYAIRFVFCSSTVAVLFCSLSLAVSKLCCTFATELRTLAALAVNSVSPKRACGALKSLCFSIFLALCFLDRRWRLWAAIRDGWQLVILCAVHSYPIRIHPIPNFPSRMMIEV